MGDPEEFVAFVEDAEIPVNHLAPMLERMPSLEFDRGFPRQRRQLVGEPPLNPL